MSWQPDTCDRSALDAALAASVAELGPIDVIIANAAISLQGLPRTRTGYFATPVDINLVGTYQSVHATVPSMIEQKAGGSIVLVSSTAGLDGEGGDGRPGIDGYVAAKHALVGLMRTWANRLGTYSIRVNTIYPTGVDTPMIRNESMLAYVKRKGERVGLRGRNT